MLSIMQADKRIHRVLRGAAAVAFWVTVWWLVAAGVKQEILVPTPLVVVKTLWSLMFSAVFWQAVGLSLLRISAGFAAALAAGTLLAVLCRRFSLLHTLFSPLLHVVRAAPVASFIILTLVWFHVEAVPVFISFLMVLPIVFVNVEEGICRTDKQLLEMAAAYRLSHRRVVKHVYVPSVMPFFVTSCVNGLGFAWKSGIAAEVICRPAWSIGRQLQGAKLSLETPEVFAWTATVVILSLLLEKGLLLLTDAVRHGAKGVRDHDNL